MFSRSKIRPITTFAAVLLAAAPAWAGPFSELFVFGDSLSDVGNVAEATLGLHPGSHYFDGRFSNGPVYAELLASHLELEPMTASLVGGNNYAYGGAQTAGTRGVQGLFIDDLDEQVDDFLAMGPADSEALLLVFAGANDLFYGQRDVAIPIGNLVNDLNRLIAAQARNLLVMNLPLLGTTPRFNGNEVEAAEMNALTEEFNNQLQLALDDLEASHPDVNMFRLDVAGLISEGISDPAKFGLTNVTDPAAPGLESGKLIYLKSRIVDNPNAYLFWDDIHPTATAHAALAERALDALRDAADFDLDWDVDADDLLQWQGDFGLNANSDSDGDGDSDGIDFLVWQQRSRIVASSLAAAPVPEPSAPVMFAGLAWLGSLFRRRAE